MKNLIILGLPIFVLSIIIYSIGIVHTTESLIMYGVAFALGELAGRWTMIVK